MISDFPTGIHRPTRILTKDRVRWDNLDLRGNLGLFAFSPLNSSQVKKSIHNPVGVEMNAFRSSLSGVEELFDNF